MFSVKKGTFAILATVAAMSLATTDASAVTVAYTTSGVFSNGSGSTYTSGDTTLSFNSATVSTSLTGPIIPTLFGSFSLSTLDGVLDPFTGSFTLTITQALPVAAPDFGTSTATITGSVSTAPGSGVVVFNFGTNPISIGTIDYTLPSFVSVSVPVGYTPGSTIGPVELTGTMNIPGNTPNVVPLPGAVTAGMALLGMMGVVRGSKKRRDAASC